MLGRPHNDGSNPFEEKHNRLHNKNILLFHPLVELYLPLVQVLLYPLVLERWYHSAQVELYHLVHAELCLLEWALDLVLVLARNLYHMQQ